MHKSGAPTIRMPSQHDAAFHFSAVPRLSSPRSTFDRSFRHKTTFNQGFLIPIFVDEALPGDTFSVRMTALCRLTTPIKPLMDELTLETFFFAVPNRLLWSHWVNFMGEQPVTVSDSTSYTVPQMNFAGGAVTSLSISDYMGLPVGVVFASTVSCLPFRAYNQIYNYWFRDENLINAVAVDIGDGPDAVTDYSVLFVAKKRDYFTSSLPWPQKPLAGNPITGAAGAIQTMGASVTPLNSNTAGHGAPTFWNEVAGTSAGNLNRSAAGANTAIDISGSGTGAGEALGWNDPQLQVLVNNIRFAFQVQHLLERDARGGTRYPEKIKAHFGVDNPDSRMQRPEYLGGGRTPIIVTPIAQNSATSITGGATAQGNLAAIGTGIVQGHGFVKSFTEHCTLIGLAVVRSEQTYQQGIERMWSRSTVFDFFWPELQFTTEQAVLNKEIYADGTGNEALTFGYQERYAEYRYKTSLVSGQFRSTATTPLDIWHLAIKYASLPTLGATFITDQAPMSRVVAVPSEPHFYFDSFFKMKCARPMAVFGVPGLVDHF